MRFTASDFLGHDMSPPNDSASRYGLENYQAERIADIANAKLAEWLGSSPVVNCTRWPDSRETGWYRGPGTSESTHRARLVDIKPIGGKTEEK